ncbi:PHB depolymerase family esterase [Actinomadura sp. HBU206391]|uniref:extracellular catalytic domain type 2 short-chain-length polyhydroxyalkanoate depolymerase n=1 Tax=Actinomadura sp. HBU206391 TaxID=2731692 RepID=UPI001650221F|nr:PHB depolymerase family esterase [Actinomadura sp. HBU206391]MBC6459639.1 poly(3-hydroxybutyrate) depolymerase [Actinomadura sp. HBU206391]
MRSALRRAAATLAAALTLTGLGTVPSPGLDALSSTGRGTLIGAGPAGAAVPPPTPGSLTRHSISGVYAAGVSSGGYMATQLHVAYSGTFRGAGIFTAGPYGCAQGNLTTAQLACMNNLYPINVAGLEQATRTRAQQGRIDPVANLGGDKVWIYHGRGDATVKESVNDSLAAFYGDFGAGVSYNKTSPAGHAWVSPIGPNPCNASYTPYVNNCGDDPQRSMLTHLFGSVAAPVSALNGKLVQFGQSAYAPGGSASSISMGANGFAYVPASCAGGASCKLMVALHGCLQGFENGAIGNKFMDKAYLNEYADSNAMIVLYPQATASSWTGGNPNGCWNWWGFGGDTSYDVKSGKQMQAIVAMVRALGG